MILMLLLMVRLYFCLIKSKNKKAAALPFVLAAPLDSEKGKDGSILTIPVFLLQSLHYFSSLHITQNTETPGNGSLS